MVDLHQLPKVKGEYRVNYPLHHLTWFKAGGRAEVLFKPFDSDDLVNFLVQNQGQLPVTVLGACSNTIIRDGGIDGVVIKLGRNFTNIEIISNPLLLSTLQSSMPYLSVGAACLNFSLAQFCRFHSISGFEFLIGIPGTIGGGVIMNAGAYGYEFKDIILAVEAIDEEGKVHIFNAEDIMFKYRGSNLPQGLIITNVLFKTTAGKETDITILMNEISARRLASQPIKEKTGGSTFANPYPRQAWQLIDQAGLRGYRIGEAEMSNLHCNFMINRGNATAEDLETLGDYVKQKVFEHSSIMLEWEIKRIGKKVKKKDRHCN